MEATIRMGGNLGFEMLIVEDACFTFERLDYRASSSALLLPGRADRRCARNGRGTAVLTGGFGRTLQFHRVAVRVGDIDRRAVTLSAVPPPHLARIDAMPAQMRL